MNDKLDQQGYARLQILVDHDVWEAVSSLASKEHRAWRDQAHILLRQKLEEMGALPTTEVKPFDEKESKPRLKNIIQIIPADEWRMLMPVYTYDEIRQSSQEGREPILGELESVPVVCFALVEFSLWGRIHRGVWPMIQESVMELPIAVSDFSYAWMGKEKEMPDKLYQKELLKAYIEVHEEDDDE